MFVIKRDRLRPIRKVRPAAIIPRTRDGIFRCLVRCRSTVRTPYEDENALVEGARGRVSISLKIFPRKNDKNIRDASDVGPELLIFGLCIVFHNFLPALNLTVELLFHPTAW